MLRLTSSLALVLGLGIAFCLNAEARYRKCSLCPSNYNPVCDHKTRTTYINKCHATCTGIPANATTPGVCPCIYLCTRDYNPVCATEIGKTYSNPCEARCAGFDENATTPGECPCICYTLYDPVCDTATGKTYGNLCEAACDGVSKKETTHGECPCICPEYYIGVCAGGTTYANDCFAKCAGFDQDAITPGKCSDCICDTLYDPVCDNETGTTYSNACQAACAGVNTTERGECPCVCTLQYDPVCANGTTYGNLCQAQCAGYSETDTTSGECPGCECPMLLDNSPVCATEINKTYASQCEAACAGFHDAVPGACDAPATSSNPCDQCPALQDPVCGISSDNGAITTTTYTNPCWAHCNGPSKPLGIYLGSCDSKADATCAASLSTASTPVCASTADAAAEFPSRCYATALGYPEGSGKIAVTIYDGQCVGPEAVLLASRACPDQPDNAPIPCFVNPCTTTNCSAAPQADCVARYCQSFYRDTYLSGLCQAVFIDPATGDLVDNCIEGLPFYFVPAKSGDDQPV